MEKVADYPRPPVVELCRKHVRIVLDRKEIVATDDALRVLETWHPPGIYVPRPDIHAELSTTFGAITMCEFKGIAHYYTVNNHRNIAWGYLDPLPDYDMLRGYMSFYPSMVEAFMDGEKVRPQPSMFYGGWITDDIEGPFKGSGETPEG
jgi:uncharacterized protein (DUF427 family)